MANPKEAYFTRMNDVGREASKRFDGISRTAATGRRTAAATASAPAEKPFCRRPAIMSTSAIFFSQVSIKAEAFRHFDAYICIFFDGE